VVDSSDSTDHFSDNGEDSNSGEDDGEREESSNDDAMTNALPAAAPAARQRRAPHWDAQAQLRATDADAEVTNACIAKGPSTDKEATAHDNARRDDRRAADTELASPTQLDVKMTFLHGKLDENTNKNLHDVPTKIGFEQSKDDDTSLFTHHEQRSDHLTFITYVDDTNVAIATTEGNAIADDKTDAIEKHIKISAGN
jgi:hypothetical protein